MPRCEPHVQKVRNPSSKRIAGPELAVVGTLIGFAARPLTAEFCKAAMIKNTTSLSWSLGRAVTLANKQANIGQIDKILIDALGGPETGRLLFAGKITHVSRRVYKGHTVGEVEITALENDEEDDPDLTRPRFTGTAFSMSITIDRTVPLVVLTFAVPFKNENLYLEHRTDDSQTVSVTGVK